MMKLVALASIFVVAPMIGGRPTPLPTFTTEQQQVVAEHKKFADAWNKHDVAGLTALWTKDGDYIEPDGRLMTGPEELKTAYGIVHASVFKDSTLHLMVERVRFVGKDVALVDGSYELLGARDPHGNAIGPRAGYFTTVLVKEKGEWKVSASRLMLPQALIWREER